MKSKTELRKYDKCGFGQLGIVLSRQCVCYDFVEQVECSP